MMIETITKDLESIRDSLCDICIYFNEEEKVCKKKTCLLCHKECLTNDINLLKKYKKGKQGVKDGN